MEGCRLAGNLNSQAQMASRPPTRIATEITARKHRCRAFATSRRWLGSVKAGMIEGLENLDPTGLQDIMHQIVVIGDPTSEGKEAAGAKDNPGFAVAFEQWTVLGGSLKLRGGRTWKSPDIGFTLAFRIAHSHKTNPTVISASLSEKTYWPVTPLTALNSCT